MNKKFDPSKLMECINSDSSPEAIAAKLDEMMYFYFAYFCTSECGMEPGINEANTFHGIRMLRNAILFGGTGIDLSK